MKQSQNNIDYTCDAMEYLSESVDKNWRTGGGYCIEGKVLISGSSGKGDFASALMALFVKGNNDLSMRKDCDETFGLYILSPLKDGSFSIIKHIDIEVIRFINNVEHLCSYLHEEVSFVSLLKLSDLHKQSLQFNKDFLDTLIVSEPLSPLVLSTLLKSGKYDPLLANLFRFHINKSKDHGYIGIYLDEKRENIGYLSGRILATMEYIKELSENKDPLRLDYARFSGSPIPMLPRLSLIAKKYVYTVPNLGRQMYLKSLIDSLLEMAKANVGTKKYLSDDEQAMFAIGYKQQHEYFADDEFVSKFNLASVRQSRNKNISANHA